MGTKINTCCFKLDLTLKKCVCFEYQHVKLKNNNNHDIKKSFHDYYFYQDIRYTSACIFHWADAMGVFKDMWFMSDTLN